MFTIPARENDTTIYEYPNQRRYEWHIAHNSNNNEEVT